jgi:hypothetical protein
VVTQYLYINLTIIEADLRLRSSHSVLCRSHLLNESASVLISDMDALSIVRGIASERSTLGYHPTYRARGIAVIAEVPEGEYSVRVIYRGKRSSQTALRWTGTSRGL